MSFHYVLDGYNLLFALPEFPPGSWEEKRAFLLNFLIQQRLHGNNALTVVFDSRQGAGDQTQVQDVRVIFTAGETADDYIAAMARAAPNPRTLVVVSNDRGIRAQVRGTGARFETATEFLKEARSHPLPTSPASQAPSPARESITEEFKKKWL